MTEKISLFKYLIKEFHEFQFPEILSRDLVTPQTNMITTLVGARRVGKTYYYFQLIQNLINREIPVNCILYVDFEDDRLFPLEVSDLNFLLEAYYELYPENKNKKKYFFFDEIQNIPNWELFIRRIGDKEDIKIFLTGSSSKLSSKEIATSLRGRTLTSYLFPLSFREFLRFKNIELEENFEFSSQRFKIKNELKKFLEFGGFPEVVLSERLNQSSEESDVIKRQILADYYDMIIYRDLVERYSIRNTILLKKMAKFLITNISNPFTINSYYNFIKKDMKVSQDTIINYLSYFFDVNVIFPVSLYSYSLKAQQINPNKIYCIDNGLRNVVSFKFSKDEGRLVENTVFIELKRKGYEVYYWKKKNEVDFVIKIPGDKRSKLSAINVSFTDTIKDREIKGLTEIKDAFGEKIENSLIITRDTEKNEDNLQYIPLWKWLLRRRT
ncbi:MAG: ATP-binding protein [Promethearchaeota archaeon]